MVFKYLCFLLGLCIFTLFAMWDFRLQSLLTEISELPCTEQDWLDQNISSSVPKPRILCWIPTGPDHAMNRSIHVKRTWGSRCDKLLFMSSVEAPRLGTVALNGVEEGHDKLWPKTQKAFQYVWEHHRNDADWFMKADDDTYVFVDNLRNFLMDYNPNDPHFFGAVAQWRSDTPVINVGGPGYVLSKEAVRRFVEVALVIGGECFTGIRPDYRGDEDSEISLCLRSVGILPEKAVDQQGRNKFSCYNPLTCVAGHTCFKKIPFEYEKSWNNGPTWMSNRPISYHVVRPHEMYILEYLTHSLQTDYSEEEES